MDKTVFKAEAAKWRDWFHKGQENWSLAHHSTRLGSIVCSVTAGAILRIRYDLVPRRSPGI